MAPLDGGVGGHVELATGEWWGREGAESIDTCFSSTFSPSRRLFASTTQAGDACLPVISRL